MFLVEAHIEDVLEDLPLVGEWIEVIKNNILKSDYPTKKIKIFYYYGFFTTKGKVDDVDYLKMPYSERLEYERKKVRVDVSMKLGKFAMSNRLPKGVIPSFIEEIIAEIVKIKMTVETDVDDSHSVKDSIPPLTGMVEFDIIEELEDQTELDMDEILDKISKNGIDSLTIEEKEFLDKKSKDM